MTSRQLLDPRQERIIRRNHREQKQANLLDREVAGRQLPKPEDDLNRPFLALLAHWVDKQKGVTDRSRDEVFHA
jgi:hypothetical protein